MAVSIPVKNGFAETCARRDDGDVVLGMVHAAIEKKKIFRTEFLQAARGGDEIVHKDDTFVRQFEARGERGGVENPRNVRGVETAVDNSAGNAEARGNDGAIGNGGERVFRESFDQVFEAGKIASGVTLFGDEFQSAAAIEVRSEITFCAADVARDDHESPSFS